MLLYRIFLHLKDIILFFKKITIDVKLFLIKNKPVHLYNMFFGLLKFHDWLSLDSQLSRCPCDRRTVWLA